MTISTQLDRTRIAELTAREDARLNENTQESGRTYERARVHLSGGVASSYQLREPWPIYLERGDGPKVWYVDGENVELSARMKNLYKAGMTLHWEKGTEKDPGGGLLLLERAQRFL